MKKFLKSFLFLLCFLTSSVFADDFSKYLELDYNSFKLVDGWMLTEISYSYPRTLLVFSEKADDTTFVAKYEVSIKISNEDSVIVNQTLERFSYSPSFSENPYYSNQKIYDLIKLNLPSGEYNLRFRIKDLTTGSSATSNVLIEDCKFTNENLCASNLVLTRQIYKSSEPTTFTRNGFEIIPDPAKLFTSKNPIVTVYSEIYNIFFEEGKDGKFTVQYKIYDAEGRRLIKELGKRTKKKPGKSAVEIQRISLVDSVVIEKVFDHKTESWGEQKSYALLLPTGTFTLAMEVEDLDNNSKFVQKKLFFVHNDKTNVQRNNASLAEAEYLEKTEEEIDKEFNVVKFVASDTEKKAFESLNLEAKRKFMPTFWKRRDPSPETSYNEMKIAFFENLQYVQNNFSTSSMREDGYKTDRGLTYLKYGQPSEIQKFDNDASSHPYQIWNYYHLQGGIEFVFVDKTNGLGEFKLVHSTAQGEFAEYNWYQRHVVVSANPFNTRQQDDNYDNYDTPAGK
ncbi:MAG: hypothetical protein DWQ06_02000 [Calditrichaeota bacterium]|nr:MAG: hypothetical protein DWQ06_02000 [Calditrichota bacterium]